MMAKVLKAVGVKEKGEELINSPVEVSSDDDFVEVRAQKKKRSKQSHRSKRRSRARSISNSSESSAPDNKEGNIKEYAQKRFLPKT